MTGQELQTATRDFHSAHDVLGQVMFGSAIEANAGLAPMYGTEVAATGPSTAPEFNM